MYKIEKVETGYVALINQARWSVFGLEYKWIPFVTITGTDEAYIHNTYDSALDNLLLKIKWEILGEN